MTAGKHDGHLGAVYDAKTPTEIAAAYDLWSATYDAEMAKAGYRHPSICLALLARHLPRGAGPLLDAGVGTGLIGEWLGIVGYPDIEGLDISDGMLAMAAKKGVYSALHKAVLGEPLPFADGAFAGVVSTGVFTTGHVGAEALPELMRICRAGAVMVITVKDAVWAAGFSDAVDAAQANGQITKIEETPSYVSMPGEHGTTPGRCIALRVT